MSVGLDRCDHPLCRDGKVTRCEGVDPKGYPYQAREEQCPRCSGRGYVLPAPGLYLVRVFGYGDNTRVRGARVEHDCAEFTGDDWDLSEECKVKWLRKVAELDGSDAC